MRVFRIILLSLFITFNVLGQERITEENRNIVFADPLQLFFKQFMVGYERLNKSNNFGLRIPVVFGLTKANKFVEIGADGKFYLTDIEKGKYFLGALGETQFRYFLGPYVSFRTQSSFKSVYVAASNGGSMQLAHGLNVSGYFSIGPRSYLDTFPVQSNRTFLDYSWNATIGWRF